MAQIADRAWRMELPTQEKKRGEPIKVTDRRIFTAEGEIKDEYRSEVSPKAPQETPPKPPPVTEPTADKKRRLQDRAVDPGTPFTTLIESLVGNTYLSLGMLQLPGQPRVPPNLQAAKQMIDIISMLAEKTSGNLTEVEAGYLETHVGELKLAYVQISKGLIG